MLKISLVIHMQSSFFTFYFLKTLEKLKFQGRQEHFSDLEKNHENRRNLKIFEFSYLRVYQISFSLDKICALNLARTSHDFR